jgi:hypothetical protein
MDPTRFAIQAVRHDERQKVAERLLAIVHQCSPNSSDLRDFIERHGLDSTSGIADVIQAVAAEVASWPISEKEDSS